MVAVHHCIHVSQILPKLNTYTDEKLIAMYSYIAKFYITEHLDFEVTVGVDTAVLLILLTASTRL